MTRKSFLRLAVTLTLILIGCSGDDGVNSPTGPEIVLSSKNLVFSAQAGVANPPSQKVVVRNGGTGTLTFSANTPADWITVTRSTGIDPDTIRVAVSTNKVGSGVHVDTITVSSSVAHNSPQYIVVNFTVDQTVGVSPPALFFPWVAGAEPPDSQVFEILNVGGGDMTYSIVKSASWLSLSHTSGTAPDTIAVTVDPTGVQAGAHVDSLVIISPEAANDSVKLAVTLAISSWTLWNDGITDAHTLQGLTFLSNNTAWALGSILSTAEHTGVAFKRADGDPSWEQILSVRNAEFGGMSFATDSIACVVGDTTMVMRTTDAGATWDTIAPIPMDSTSALWAIEFASPDTGFAVGPLGTIIRTIDAGLSWQALTSPVLTSLAALASADNNNVWLTGNHGEILFTSNGGDNWTMQNSGTTTDLFEIEFIDYLQGWAVGGNGIVIHTLDGGATWERQDVGATTNLHDVYFFTEMRGWIIGDSGTIVYTSDGGQNWIRQFLPDPDINQPSLYEIEFLAGDTGVVVGADGTVYRTVSGGF